MINTLNESHLHEKIKKIYACEYSAVTEHKIESYIADVYSQKNGIFEIQTGSFSHLRHKIEFYLSKKYRITVVFPFAQEKTILTKNKTGEIVSKRKSPQHKNYYTCFRELTSLVSFILNPNFSIHLLPCTVIEERTAEKEKVQTKNNSRRFLKDYTKTGKKLESTGKTYILKTKQDYRNLLGTLKDKDFTFADLKETLKNEKISIKERNLRSFVWVLEKTGIIHRAGTDGKKIIYSAKKI